MRVAVIAVLALILYLSAGADRSRSAKVRFHTVPERAKVELLLGSAGPQFLGYSDVSLNVPIPPKSSEIDIRFSKEGYEERIETIGAYAFEGGLDRWPREGVIELRPTNSIPWWVFLLGGAGVAGAGTWLGLRKIAADASATEGGEGRLGNLEILDVLGRGGMATVYRARTDSGEEVAVKVMREDLSENPEYRARFEREIKVCLQLDHPGIVRLEDWSLADQKLHLVMELVDGTTLRERLEKGLTDVETARYLVALLEAVDYAHQLGIVHRDLKPDNVMITHKGRLKVMDFGLARDENSATITQSGVALGTPAYMAPEQIKSEPYSPATDQYALGMIAYEMLGGQHPFAGEEGYVVIHKHLADMPPPVRQFRPELPEPLDAILHKMVAKEVDQRYPSLADVKAELERVFWPEE